MTVRPDEPPQYTPQARAERLIALGRFILASFSLLAVYFEPSTPGRLSQFTYTLLGAYTAYTIVLLALTWRSPVAPARQRLLSHVVDLLLFSVFIYLTEGPASPFFVYFVFSLFCATLRFRWRGIVATGVAAIVIYGAISTVALLLHDPLFEWSRVVIRIVYLILITTLLAYLGAYQEQLRSELASLAAWPREVGTHLDAILRTSLEHAAELLRSSRVIFIWEEPEEPWVYTATWEWEGFRVERAAPGRYDFAELPPTSFLVRDTTPPSILTLDAARRRVSEEARDAVGGVLRSEHGIRFAVGVTIRSESVSGRLIAAQEGAATADDLILADIVGRLLLGSLEQFFFVRQLRQTASAEERLRIARDLHDGVIQSLGGTGLQLQSIRSVLGSDPAAAADRLAHVQRVIEREQHELRDLVRELRPSDPAEDGAIDLQARLRQLEERFLLEWNMTVDVHSSLAGRVPAAATVEICRIVNESLSNAARHGRASRASVEIAADDSNIRIRVSDNGRGFAFAGRHDLAALQRLNQGPKTVKERVMKLGGTLFVDSGPNGAAVEAVFPLPTGAR